MGLELDIEEIRGRFGNGICCAMSVFGELAELMGMVKELARKIASGFCGHYEHNNFCGCVSGAKMALGMKYGPSKLGDNDKAVVLKEKLCLKQWLCVLVSIIGVAMVSVGLIEEEAA